MLTPAQLRAARALLGWARVTLAKRSGTAAETVQDFEARGSDPRLSTLIAWRRAIEDAGVEFLDAGDGKGPGVRLRSDRPELPLRKPSAVEKPPFDQKKPGKKPPR